MGAQRRSIADNDLPVVETEIVEYFCRFRDDEPLDGFSTKLGLVVAKDRIAANGEYNLSGERYYEHTLTDTHYPWHPLGNLIDTITPPAKIPKSEFGQTGLFPIIDQSQNDIAGYTNDPKSLITPDKPLVIFGDHTCMTKLVETPFAQGADGIKIINTKEELDPRFLYHVLRNKPLKNDGYRRHFTLLKEYEIPLPPMEVQREIVAEIEGYQGVINDAQSEIARLEQEIQAAIGQVWSK